MKILIYIYLIFFMLFGAIAQEQEDLLFLARDILSQQKTELLLIQGESKTLKDNLNNANVKIRKAENAILEFQTKVDVLHKWGVDQNAEKWKYFEESEKQKMEKEKAIVKYHFSKKINSVTAAILGLFLGLWLMRIVPVIPPYSAYAFLLPIVLPVIGYWAIWLFL